MNICASTLQQIVNLGLSCFPLSMWVSGVGGNLVAVQASRISTYLHMNGLPMGDPNPTPRKCPTPCTSFFGSCKYTGGTECSTVFSVGFSPQTLPSISSRALIPDFF